MTLPRPHLLLLPPLLLLATSAWAAERAAGTRPAQSRPLNLSLPRDILHEPGRVAPDETVQRNLRAPVPVGAPPTPAPRLPYGAGYESRHVETGGAGAGPGGASAGSGGAGRRGR